MELMREPEVLRAGGSGGPARRSPRPRVPGRALSLSVRELDVLVALVRNKGRIVPREELYSDGLGRAAARS